MSDEPANKWRLPRHPSGRPIHPRKWGTETALRRPLDGPLNPRLQPKSLAEAVGFHRYIIHDED